MTCKCGGLLIRIDSHLERRIAKARRDYISDSYEFSLSPQKELK